ncbi:MAG TPA: I78 family peptidase inhibitor [Lysobacter sp.]|nr:I78 family peptidase inhibitor [Lysobacter sp.]
MSRFVFPLAAILSLSITACATTESSEATSTESTPPAASASTEPAAAAQPEQGCNADAARSVVGQLASEQVVEQARTAAGAELVRTLKPGQMVTMEYNASRLNIDVDANNTITNVRCG